MSLLGLDIEKLKAPKTNYSVLIESQAQDTIRFTTAAGTAGRIKPGDLTISNAIYTDDEINIEAALQYSQAHAATANALAVADKFAGPLFRLFGSGKTLKNKLMTRLKWEETSLLSFPLSLLFIATSDSETEVMTPVKKLYAAVFPLRSFGLLEAPLQYSGGDDHSGLFTVSIGRWFTMPNSLITNVSPRFSRQVGPDGKPLWAIVSVTFTYFELLLYDELLNFFQEPSAVVPNTPQSSSSDQDFGVIND